MTSAEKQRLIESISEGLVRKYEEEMSGIEKHPRCSKQHYEKMSDILGFKVKAPTRIMKRGVVAILLAAALLLTGCAIFRNEIRNFFVEIYETFIRITFDDGQPSEEETIGDVYEPTSIPDGYTQTNAVINPLIVRYEYANSEGHYITFEQFLLDSSKFLFDAENEVTASIAIGDYEVYYHCLNSQHRYIWNDGKYAMAINTDMKLQDEDLAKLINGISRAK